MAQGPKTSIFKSKMFLRRNSRLSKSLEKEKRKKQWSPQWEKQLSSNNYKWCQGRRDHGGGRVSWPSPTAASVRPCVLIPSQTKGRRSTFNRIQQNAAPRRISSWILHVSETCSLRLTLADWRLRDVPRQIMCPGWLLLRMPWPTNKQNVILGGFKTEGQGTLLLKTRAA